MPRLVRDWFAQQNAGEHATILRSRELAVLADAAREAPRRIVRAVLGSGLLIAAAVLFALDQTGPRWFGYPASAWIAAGGALIAFLLARASKRP
jgi:ubiquinone biosynthesis protein